MVAAVTRPLLNVSVRNTQWRLSSKLFTMSQLLAFKSGLALVYLMLYFFK